MIKVEEDRGDREEDREEDRGEDRGEDREEDRGEDRGEDSCYLAVVNNFKFSPKNEEAP